MLINQTISSIKLVQNELTVSYGVIKRALVYDWKVPAMIMNIWLLVMSSTYVITSCSTQRHVITHHITYCTCIIPVYMFWWNDDCFRYVRPGGYPVGTPYNESFPGNFHLRRNLEHHVVSVTNNQSSLLVLQAPQSGPWFIASFLPKKSSEKITQKVTI